MLIENSVNWSNILKQLRRYYKPKDVSEIFKLIQLNINFYVDGLEQKE